MPPRKPSFSCQALPPKSNSKSNISDTSGLEADFRCSRVSYTAVTTLWGKRALGANLSEALLQPQNQ